MAGALGMMARRRRRYADGGDVIPSDDTQGGDNFISDAQTQQQAPQQQGALAGAAENANTGAAINRGIRNLSGQASLNILAASGQQPSPMFEAALQSPPMGPPADDYGRTNLPMLAAAGAFLEPTHSGGFSEALGNAFKAAVPVAEKERQIQANKDIWSGRVGVQQQNADTAALRQQALQTYLENKAKYVAMGYEEKVAQDMAMRDYRSTMANVASQRATTYDQAVTNRAGLQAAQTSLAEARADALRNPKATNASIMQDAIEAMKQKINPDTNTNFTDDEALMLIKGVTQRADVAYGQLGVNQQNATTRATRVQDQADQAAQVEKRRLQDAMKTDEWRQAQLQMRGLQLDAQTKGRIDNSFRTLVMAGTSPKKAMDVAISSEGQTADAVPSGPRPVYTPRTAPGAATGAAPDSATLLEQARAALGRGIPRAAVVGRLKSLGVDPGGL